MTNIVCVILLFVDTAVASPRACFQYIYCSGNILEAILLNPRSLDYFRASSHYKVVVVSCLW